MNIEVRRSPNKSLGRNRMEVIVIHHWDDPSKNPSLNGVVSWLTNPASQVSAHYVVSDKRVIQLLNEDEIGWHAREANPFSIGIEIDPNVQGDTYKTVAALVRDIRSRRGNIPLKRHRDYVNTSCPGNIDVERIDRESKNVSQKEDDMSKVSGLGVDHLFRTKLGRTCDPKQKQDLMKTFDFDGLNAWIESLPEYKNKVAAAKRGEVNFKDFLVQDYRGAYRPQVRNADVKKINDGIKLIQEALK